jgi:hypothetical protein
VSKRTAAFAAALALIIGGVVDFAWPAPGHPTAWTDIRIWVGFAVVVIGVTIALVLDGFWELEPPISGPNKERGVTATMESYTETNQRESDNLMNIVAVVYGVAITIALTMSGDAILDPVSAAELIPSVALLAAVLLTAFSFYSYVLAIGQGSGVFRSYPVLCGM